MADPVVPFWERNCILEVLTGSRAYGLDGPESDVDTKGVCIPTREILLGLASFEQWQDATGDRTIFALKKVVRLGLEGNPNVIELLHAPREHHLRIDAFGERLWEARHLFLSRQVAERFCGYAVSQLKRLQGHHRWLTAPPAGPPDPATFGGELVSGRWRFPHVDAQNRFRAEQRAWTHYEKWRRERHPGRAALEARHGYDTKHAMHLLRLLRMGEEILRDGIVHVQRPDAEWLRGVRDGALGYDEVLALARDHEARLQELERSSPLPEKPDGAAADALLIALHEDFLKAKRR